MLDILFRIPGNASASGIPKRESSTQHRKYCRPYWYLKTRPPSPKEGQRFRRQDRPRQRRRREREIKQGCEREHARSRGRPTIYDDFQGWCGATARPATGTKRHNFKPYCPSSSQMLTFRTGTLRRSSFGEEAPSFPSTCTRFDGCVHLPSASPHRPRTGHGRARIDHQAADNVSRFILTAPRCVRRFQL